MKRRSGSELTFSNWQHTPDGEGILVTLARALRRPGREANPLILTGGPGTGKSHLLRAISEEAKRSRPARRVRYFLTDRWGEMIPDPDTPICQARNVGRRPFGNRSSPDLILVDDAHHLWANVEKRDALREIVTVGARTGAQVILAGRWGRAEQRTESIEGKRNGQSILDDGPCFPGSRTLRLSPLPRGSKAEFLVSLLDRRGVELSRETAFEVAGELADDMRHLLATADRIYTQAFSRGNSVLRPEDIPFILPWTWFRKPRPSPGSTYSLPPTPPGTFGNRPGDRNQVVVSGFSNDVSRDRFIAGWPDEPGILVLYEGKRRCGGCAAFVALDEDWGLCFQTRSSHAGETVPEMFACGWFREGGWKIPRSLRGRFSSNVAMSSRAGNRNRIFTGDFSRPESKRSYREGWPDDPATRALYRNGSQCGQCGHYAELNTDWGLCLHPSSPHRLETVFEHFTCGWAGSEKRLSVPFYGTSGAYNKFTTVVR